MPRPAKGPHLWFREARYDPKTGKLVSSGQWLILDAGKQTATGCDRDEIGEAEANLAEYILAKQGRPVRVERDIEVITVSEVIATFVDDCFDRQANQRTFLGRMKRLNAWWGEMKLAEVNGQTCREYTTSRGTPGGARRDLEDLRAAITHHSKEGLHRGTVRVSLPPKGPPRDRWLTRSEAARLIWAAWRHREVQTRHRGPDKGKRLPTSKRPLQHVARFILIALYTGTRAGAVASASPYRNPGHAWVDLDKGLFYRLAEGKKATNKRQPTVRLPPHLLAHMRRWKRTAISTSHFVEHNGRPVVEVSGGFEKAVELAKLEGKVTAHTLRHTAATWLMQNGVEIWEAAGFLGMSEELLRSTYGHHHPDFMKGAAAGFRPKRSSNEIPMKSRDKEGTNVNNSEHDEANNADNSTT